MEAKKFVVSNLTSQSKKIPDIERTISMHSGINAVRVDFQASTITVDYDEKKHDADAIKGFVSQAGFDVTDIK